MRKRLFKAKWLCNGKWLMGGIIERDDKAYIVGISKKLRIDGVEVDPNTICQYTGLTDKNGNEIWENDVVNYKNESVGYDKNGIVKFGEYHSGFDGNANHIGFFIEWNSDCLRKDIGFWAKNRELEVIGDIFDNPELIGGDS